MRMQMLWDRCIFHRGDDTERFLREYFAQENRKVLLISGAGFDPRATIAATLLAQILGTRISGVFVREQRPNPPKVLVDGGNQSEEALKKIIENHRVEHVPIFDSDEAVIGGQQIVKFAKELNLNEFSDIVVDASALSTGVLFPLTKYLLGSLKEHTTNLHLLVGASSQIDTGISSVPHDTTSMIHGFKGGFGLFEAKEACKLWLPQLIPQQGPVLAKIYSAVEPDLVCPILPFPSRSSRLVDELLEEYADSLANWSVDNRNFVFAAEDDPLDLYRTILQIDASRSRIFQNIGGSKTVISPVGSKLLAIGSLLAAIEKNFPVVYVESISYKVQPSVLTAAVNSVELVHLWLAGEAYGSQRTAT